MWRLIALILLVAVFACGEDLPSPPAMPQPITQTMNLDLWTFLNLVLTSGLVSSIASGGLLWWLTARKERKQLLRTKLEELFKAHEDFCEAFEIRFLAIMTEIQYRPGRIQEYREAPSSEAKRPQFFQQDSDQDEEQKRKCEMLVLLYLKEFLPQWERMMRYRNELLLYKSKCQRATFNEDCLHLIEPFREITLQFRITAFEMRGDIVQMARKLNSSV